MTAWGGVFRTPWLAGFASIAAMALVDCTVAEGDVVTPRVEIIVRKKNALSASGITSVGGTYSATCNGRSGAGTDTWTVSVSGGPATDELSV